MVVHTSHIPRRSNLLTKPGLKQEDRLSKFGLISPNDSRQVRNWKTLGVWLLVMSFTVPVFRSGGKTGLTFWGWIRNHTIFAEPGPEYVPFEDYSKEFE